MKRNLILIITALSALCLGIASAWAQPRKFNKIDHYLFPAELVMRHYQEIDLTDGQQKAIRAEMKKVQNALFDRQWELEKATGALEKLVSRDKVKEDDVLAQMDEVIKLEHKIKRARMAMLVRIRNILTPEQRNKLNEYKRLHGQRFRPSGGFGDRRQHRPSAGPGGGGPGLQPFSRPEGGGPAPR